MQFRLKKTITQATVLAALLPSLTLLVNDARAHEREVPATLLDPSQSPARGDYAYHAGQTAVRTGVTGECVGTGTWSPGGATVECHPAFFAAPESAARSAPSTAASSGDAAGSEGAGGGAAAAGAAAAAAAAASAAPMQKLDPANAPERGAYVYDSFARNARTGVTGECVKTGTWTPEGATPACDPDLFATPGAAPRAAAAPEPAAEPAPEPIGYEAMQYEDPPASPPVEAAAAAAAGAVSAADAEDFYAPGDAPDLLPVPSPDSFPPEPADDRLGEPVMYYDEEEGVAHDDGITETLQYGNDDSGIAQDDGITGTLQYGSDDSGIVPDDGIVEVIQYGNDDSGISADDGIVAHYQFGGDDSGIQPDEGISGETVYYEEESVASADDLIGEPRAFNDEPMAIEVDEPAPVAAPTPEPEPAPVAEAAPEPQSEPEPAAAATPVEPEPQPAAAAAPAEPEPEPVILPVTITLEAEALFDFDRSKVRSPDQERLDKLVTGLNGVDYERILIVGHADRIGTESYNERLSLRRANAVKDYLVKQGVQSDRLLTEGRGEFEPSTDPMVCQGLRKKKLIDCLQPDRRVEVTVTGQSQKQ